MLQTKTKKEKNSRQLVFSLNICGKQKETINGVQKHTESRRNTHVLPQGKHTAVDQTLELDFRDMSSNSRAVMKLPATAAVSFYTSSQEHQQQT